MVREFVSRYLDERRVAWVTLNRPERHNALVPALVAALRNPLARARAAEPVALALQAEGTAFSTGGDVAEFPGHETHRSMGVTHGNV